jgi:hypothetical protein
MNLFQFVVDKNFCLSCIIIKQKIKFHNNFVIFNKHFLNLMWNNFVESSILNDKIYYFVTFLCDFIKRSVIYAFHVKSNTFDVFKHFQQHNEHENNRIRRFRIDWKKNTQTTNLTIIILNTTFNENQSCQKLRNKTKSSNVCNKSLC